MANDKITMLKLKRMLQLLDAGKSMNEICRDLHMSKRTVHNYKQRVTSSSVPLAECAILSKLTPCNYHLAPLFS